MVGSLFLGFISFISFYIWVFGFVRMGLSILSWGKQEQSHVWQKAPQIKPGVKREQLGCVGLSFEH